MALARLHQSLAVGATEEVAVARARWSAGDLLLVLEGAGFEVNALGAASGRWRAGVTRLRTLPDFVGPGMRLLICGLNPSLYAADAGLNFARPGNRFWPAAMAAGLVAERDPWAALAAHSLGLTDLVKRATPRADALGRHEYRAGVARLTRLVDWLSPAAVCFVGLAGWRAAINRHAAAGPQPERFAGRPAYVMPSTSGLNARTSLGELAGHLRAAAALDSGRA